MCLISCQDKNRHFGTLDGSVGKEEKNRLAGVLRDWELDVFMEEGIS